MFEICDYGTDCERILRWFLCDHGIYMLHVLYLCVPHGSADRSGFVLNKLRVLETYLTDYSSCVLLFFSL